MKQDNGIEATLATRLLAGEASESERRGHRDRMARDAAYRSDWEQWLLVWDAAGSVASNRREADIAWDRLQKKTLASGPLLSRRSFVMGLAAAAFILVAALIPWLWSNFAHDTEVLLSAGGNEIQTIVLEDGTRVSLNTDSRLTYPEEFGSYERRVFLTGEAWFEVASQGGRPFYVETEDLEIRVVGTSFNVRAWPDYEGALVEVGSGKVAVTSNLAGNEEILLQGGEGLVFHRSSGRMEQAPVNVNYLAWMTGQLSFEDTPLSEVLETLERTYRRSIIADNPSILEERLGGSFSNQSFEHVVGVLCTTFKLEQHEVDGAVVLSRP